MIHSGERPYACPKCPKRFNQQGNLSKHIKAHDNAHLRWNRNTKEKPFKCPHPDCDKSFTVKINLENHLYNFHRGAAIPMPVPTSSKDDHNPQFQPFPPGSGFSNLVLAVRATEVTLNYSFTMTVRRRSSLRLVLKPYSFLSDMITDYT